MTHPLASIVRATAWLTAALLAGCVTYGPGSVPVGTTLADTLKAYGAPDARYPVEGGGERLEYDGGTFARETYMLDFDPQGRLAISQQVRTEANFGRDHAGDVELPGASAPRQASEVFAVQRQHIVVWNYRFPRGDCVWFQASIDDAGKVTEAGISSDPVCDHGPNHD